MSSLSLNTSIRFEIHGANSWCFLSEIWTLISLFENQQIHKIFIFISLVFIYSNFRSLEGIELFSKILDFNGYSSYKESNNKPKYAIYSGDEDEKVKKEILQIFTSPENKTGKFIKIILATLASAEGLDLKNIRQIHIIEPYWNQMKIKQIIGRGVRRDSHMSLPPKDRNIEIYRYFSYNCFWWKIK